MKIYCACGCNNQLEELDNRGRKRKYIRGHQAKAMGLCVSLQKYAKSHGAWNKGMKGLHLNAKDEFKKGMTPWNKGMKGFMSGDKHYLFGKKLPEETLKKISDENSHNWKDDDVGYSGVHRWIIRTFGKANHCDLCGRTNGKYEWHNIDRTYRRNIKDWISLCTKCHHTEHRQSYI